jgi:hypothetical protein
MGIAGRVIEELEFAKTVRSIVVPRSVFEV